MRIITIISEYVLNKNLNINQIGESLKHYRSNTIINGRARLRA